MNPQIKDNFVTMKNEYLKLLIISISFFLPKIENAQVTWDSTQYVKYSDRLIISSFVSNRRFACNIDQKYTEADSGKSALDYYAEANTVTGLQVNYDKISFGFGWNSGSPDLRTKGRTKYRDLSISIGENKWILDGSIRSYKGFYDKNTENYIDSFKINDPFVQLPGMEIRQMRARFRYFLNNKNFAYAAGYGYTCRQLKSAFTWVLGGGILNNRVGTDTNFFHPNVRPWYDMDSSLKSIDVTGLNFGGGFSWNLVIFKRLFMNVTFNLYLEPQWRKYQNTRYESYSKYYTATSADGRFALGYNGRNFFYFINGTADFNKINTTKFSLETRFISGSVSIGYRFKVKCPRFYSKFKETWLYKKL
jgi:hypothetical protein